MAKVKNYFEWFPRVNFGGRQIVDITRRAAFLKEIAEDDRLCGFYKIRGGETPWGLAHDFYGSEEYDWIIFGINKVVNPFFDWCLSQVELEKLIELKYPNGTRYDVHHWVLEGRIYYDEPLATDTWQPSTVYQLREQAVPVSSDGGLSKPYRFAVKERSGSYQSGLTEPNWPATYGSTVADGDLVWENIGSYTHPLAIEVTNQEFEELENEKKRIIRVLRPRYLTNVISEFDKVMRGVRR